MIRTLIPFSKVINNVKRNKESKNNVLSIEHMDLKIDLTDKLNLLEFGSKAL